MEHPGDADGAHTRVIGNQKCHDRPETHVGISQVFAPMPRAWRFGQKAHGLRDAVQHMPRNACARFLSIIIADLGQIALGFG